MVYLRAKKFRRKKDKKGRTYFYVVEAKRVEGKVQQRVVRYLGSVKNILEKFEFWDQHH